MHHCLVFACRVIVCVLLVGLCACQSADTPKADIRIAYLPITHALPVLMERELLPDPDLRVELVRYGSWPELMDALNSGRVDGASVLAVLAVKAREQGIPLKMAALAHRGGNVVVAGARINRVADLQGGTIAVPHRQSSHHILVRRMLDEAGLAPESVRIVELAPAEMPAALARGSVDAYCVAEPFGAQAVALGSGKVLYHGDDLWPQSLCCALVFNEQFLQRRPDIAKRYVAAHAKAGEAASQRPDLARTVAARELKADGAVLDASLDWISFADLALRAADYARLAELMTRYGLTSAAPAYEQVVDTGASSQ